MRVKSVLAVAAAIALAPLTDAEAGEQLEHDVSRGSGFNTKGDCLSADSVALCDEEARNRLPNYFDVEGAEDQHIEIAYSIAKDSLEILFRWQWRI